MFSYRHAFHAGNHADVLKHTMIVATMRHLVTKETALTLVDTHAGAGLYRLDGDYATTSGEAGDGVLRLRAPAVAATTDLAPALVDYLDLVASFNAAGKHKVYPGSPFLLHRLARPQDRLKLFELHPTDARSLQANIEQLEAGRQIATYREDGFTAVRRFLPPPSRRALLLCDPSYEIKTDYGRVAELIDDCLRRFATGTYIVWHPIIARQDAHQLPRRLKTLAERAGRPWLHATLTVKSARQGQGEQALERSAGLPASGMFLINPPHTLHAALATALPQMAALLGQDRNAGYTLERHGH